MAHVFYAPAEEEELRSQRFTLPRDALKHPKFTCPETGLALSKPFEDMTVGEYYDETGIDLLFRAVIGMSGGIVRPTGGR